MKLTVIAWLGVGLGVAAAVALQQRMTPQESIPVRNLPVAQQGVEVGATAVVSPEQRAHLQDARAYVRQGLMSPRQFEEATGVPYQ